MKVRTLPKKSGPSSFGYLSIWGVSIGLLARDLAIDPALQSPTSTAATLELLAEGLMSLGRQSISGGQQG